MTQIKYVNLDISSNEGLWQGSIRLKIRAEIFSEAMEARLRNILIVKKINDELKRRGIDREIDRASYEDPARFSIKQEISVEDVNDEEGKPKETGPRSSDDDSAANKPAPTKDTDTDLPEVDGWQPDKGSRGDIGYGESHR